jgi:penicillin-binding protein 1C
VLARAEAVGVIDADAAARGPREALPAARRAFPNLAPHLADRLRAAEPERGSTAPPSTSTCRPRSRSWRGRAARPAAQATLALLVADPDSGAILASVGSADYTSDARRGFVDMTQALRSPGSTLKPLVYGLAFSDALAHPETMLDDRPASYAGYAPQNFDHTFRGPSAPARPCRPR